MAQTEHRMPRVESLTGLRWFAAFFVFVHHIANLAPIRSLTAWSWLGVTGVTFFFVLSGFVLTWSWFPRDTPRRFYWRRFARIYPLHLITTLIAVPVFYGGALKFQKPFEGVAVLLSLLLVHAWFTPTGVFFAGNPASWSLSDEAFFYSVFPSTIRRLSALRLRTSLWFAAATVVAMWAVLILVVVLKPGPAVATFALRSPMYRVLEFLLGIALAVALRQGWRPRIGLWPALAILFVALALLVTWSRVPHLQHMLKATSMMEQVTAPCYALIIVAAASRDVRGLSSFLRHPYLIKLGHWSYAFYLTHATVIYALLLWHGGPIRGALPVKVGVIGVTLAMSISLAWLLYHFVEHPTERRLRGMLPPLEEYPEAAEPVGALE
jgi:peptidoglycan/LPS O-acetylase OafA/YrhL